MKKFLLSIFAVMLAVLSVQAQTYVYQKVTSAPSDWSGDYLIVYEDGNVAFNGALTTLDATSNTISVSISNGEIAADETTNNAIFTIAKSGDSYTIKSKSGKYIGNNSNSNALTSSTSELLNTISIEDGSPKIIGKGGSVLRYNATSGQYRFRYFKSGTYKNQKAIALYKYTEESGETSEPEQPETPAETVANPVISPYSVTFNEGETLNVTIETTTEGADIYYTLDGTEPSAEHGELYEGEIEITATTTVKAIAVKDGCNDSGVVTKTYTMKVTLGRLSVAEAIAAYDANNKADVTIVGYIVGVVNNNVNEFTGSTTVNKNLLIADNPNETNGENCIPVQLPSGTVRNELNLKDNSGIYKKKVALTGSLETYFKVAGLKEVSAYEFVEEEEPATETWSSFYAIFPVAIPEGVEAYIVTAANAGYVTLTQIYNAVPANTGVILKGGSIKATNDNYYSGEVTEVTGNLLKGTMINDYIIEEAYVLAKVDGVIGLYKAEMNQLEGTAWLNNANKAYLPASVVPTSAQGAASFSFRFGEGTTGVENVVVENGVNVIFDLTGRKVESISAPGIYIVNGVKRVVR